MENLSMCRICLATDVRLCSIASHLRDMFERISSMTFKREDWRPLVACYICHARLQNCYRLRTSCIRSEELLTEMMSSGEFKAQGVLSINSFSVVSTVHISIGHVLQESKECHIKEGASEAFDQQNTEDIKMEPQEEHDAQMDEDMLCSHLEDPLDVMKREPDDVETDAEYINLCEGDINIDEIGWKPDIAGTSSQSADNKCPKIVKVVLERIDLNDSRVGARVSNKPKLVARKDTDDATTNKQKIGVIENEQTEIITNMEAKTVIDFKKCENVGGTFIDRKVCEEKSTNKSLEQHVNSITSSSSKKFSCDTCKKCFNVKSNLTKHIRIHTGEKPYQCNVCKKCFSQNCDLTKHVSTHTGEKPYQCNFCKKYFNQKRYLKTHIRTHTGKKSYQCNVCKKCYNQKRYLKTHIRTHTGKKPYQCNVCKKCFSEKYYYQNHIRTHTDEKPYECNVCKKCFIQRSDLTKHVRKHTGDKPQCNFCKKRFNQKSYLKIHFRTHTGEKPFQCNVCKKCFLQKSDLANHVRTHTGDKPYQCNFCKKCFFQKKYLNTHIRTHTGDKPYQCDICKKCFNQKSDLTKHVRTHTGEKPYQCNVCKKCFSQKVHLKNHIRMHTGEKP